MNRNTVYIFVVFVVLKVLDIALTYIGLSVGLRETSELSLLALDIAGFPGLVLKNILGVLVLGIAIFSLPKKYRSIPLLSAVLVQGYIVVENVQLILTHTP